MLLSTAVPYLVVVFFGFFLINIIIRNRSFLIRVRVRVRVIGLGSGIGLRSGIGFHVDVNNQRPECIDILEHDCDHSLGHTAPFLSFIHSYDVTCV